MIFIFIDPTCILCYQLSIALSKTMSKCTYIRQSPFIKYVSDLQIWTRTTSSLLSCFMGQRPIIHWARGGLARVALRWGWPAPRVSSWLLREKSDLLLISRSVLQQSYFWSTRFRISGQVTQPVHIVEDKESDWKMQSQVWKETWMQVRDHYGYVWWQPVTDDQLLSSCFLCCPFK